MPIRLVLRSFLYAHDGRHPELLVPGERREITASAIPGLETAGYIAVAPADPVRETAPADGHSSPVRRRRSG